MNRTVGVIHDAAEFRKLISENPDLPVVVCVGEDANSGDYSYMFASSISCSVVEILDCFIPGHEEIVIEDKDYLEEIIEDNLWDEYHTKSEEEYDSAVKEELKKYEPYWTKVIALYID